MAISLVAGHGQRTEAAPAPPESKVIARTGPLAVGTAPLVAESGRWRFIHESTHRAASTDWRDRGHEAVGTVPRLLAGSWEPVIHVEHLPMVGLRSSQHFRAGFGHLAGAMLTRDAPGLTTNRVEVFEHRRAGQPLWPRELR